MKQGRTLPDLAAELERQVNAKRDFLAPAEALCVRSNGHTDLMVKDAYTVNEVAHGQLAEYLGIPKGYYDRLRGATADLRIPMTGPLPQPLDADPETPSGTSLFDAVVNCLLANKGGDTRLVRTLDGKARAFLSQSYSVDLDNYDVLRVAVKAMEQSGLCPEDVAACEVTERRLYLKVVSPRLEARIEPSNLHREHGGHHFLKEPAVVQAGFVLSNSETGLGSLSVQQTIYKLQCTNLWITEDAYRQRHLGKALQSDGEGAVYRDDTRLADARARLLKIRDHISEALSETRFRATVAQMQQSTDIRLEGGPEKVVEVTARRFGLSQIERDEVLKQLIEGADLSYWGLSNALTATAQSVPSFDRATEIEAIGGRMLALPKGEVKEIVTAR
jgi:hypothetical protein